MTCISGYVLNLSGRPLSRAEVEIWLCDYQSFYFHPRHMDQRDPAFSGGDSGHERGRFLPFRTIRPVSCANRAPHTHFKVRGTAFEELTTQMYVEDEPCNEQDFVLNAIAEPADRVRLIVPLQPAPQHEPGAFSGRFDIMGGYEKTVVN